MRTFFFICLLSLQFIALAHAADFDLPSPHTSETTPDSLNQREFIGTIVTSGYLPDRQLIFSVQENVWFIDSTTGEIYRKAGQSINLEAPTVSLPATVSVQNLADHTTLTHIFTITIDNVNEPPTAIGFTPGTALFENTLGAVAGSLSTTDPDANDSFVYTLSDSRFQVVNSILKLKVGNILNFESEPSITLTVFSRDVGGLPAAALEQSLTLTVRNVNEPPTAIVFNATNTLFENTPGAEAGIVNVNDPDAGDAFAYTVSDARFEIVNSHLKLKSGNSLNRESEALIHLILTARDSGGLPATPLSLPVDLTVLNVNEPPTAISFVPAASLLENNAGAVAGTLSTADPDSGDTFVYVLSDSRFEVIASTLKLKSTAALDFETEPVVHLTVTARDAGGLPSTPLLLTLNLNVSNVNEAPTAINFTPGTLLENTPGAVAGTLSTVDPDVGDTFAYSVDDSRFHVVGSTLALTGNASLNRETEPTVTLTITARDVGGLPSTPLTRTLTLNVGNVNEPPTAITFAPSGRLFENTDSAVAGTVSTLDPDLGDTFVYSVSDTRFEIVASILKLKAGNSLDFETEPIISLRLGARDSGGLPATALSLSLTLAVQNLNEAPTAISFTSGTAIPENTPGALAGSLSTTDPDTGDVFTYNVDDDRFEVVGSSLRLKVGKSLDFEREPSVTLQVSARDLGGLPTVALTQTITLAVTNRNEAPTTIIFVAADAVAENTPGCLAGRLGTLDPDANDVFTYAVDDLRFEIVNDVLQLKAEVSVDFEAEPTIDVVITSHDAGNLSATPLALTLQVNNRNEPPTAISMSASGRLFENTRGAVAGTLNATDPDAGDSFTYQVADQRFEMHGASLQLSGNNTLDFETQPTLVVPITVTDAAGETYTQDITLTTVDQNDPPTVPRWSTIQLAVFDASTPLPLSDVADMVTDADLHSANPDYLDFHGFGLQLSYKSDFDDHLALIVPPDLTELYFLLNDDVYLKGTATRVAHYQLNAQQVTLTVDDNRRSTLAELANLLRLVVFTPDAGHLNARLPLTLSLRLSDRNAVVGWEDTRKLNLDTANVPPTLQAPAPLAVTRFSQISITPAMLGITDEHPELGLTLIIDYPTLNGKLYTAQRSKLLGPDDEVLITYADGALQLDLIYVPDASGAADADTCFLSVRDHGARAGVTAASWLHSPPSKVSLHIGKSAVPVLRNTGDSTYTEGAEAVTVVQATVSLGLGGLELNGDPLQANLGGWNFYVSYASGQPHQGPPTTSEMLGVRESNGLTIGDDGRTMMRDGNQVAQIEATATGSASALVFILSSTCSGADVLALATAVTYRDASLRLPLAASDPQTARPLFLGFVHKKDPTLLADVFTTVVRTGIDNPPAFSDGTQRTIITVSNQPILGSSMIEDIDTPDTPSISLTPVNGGEATVQLTRGPVDTGATYRTTLSWKVTRDSAASGDQDFILRATIGNTTLTHTLTLSPRSGSDLGLAIVSDAPLALIKPSGSANPLQRAVRMRRGAAVVNAAIYLLGATVPPWISIDSTAGTVSYDLADGGAVVGQTYYFSLLATTATSAAEQPVILRVVGPSAGSGTN